MFPSGHFQEAEAPSILQPFSPRKEATEIVLEAQDTLTHKLPPEIVSRVFTFCLPTTDLEQLPEAALSLGAICRKCRCIARRSPRLWRTIFIIIPSFHYALRLQITLPKLVNGAVQYLASILLDTFKLYSERWETLDLTLPLPRFADKFRVLSDVKNLRQLSLTSNIRRVRPQFEPLFGAEVSPIYLALSRFPLPLGVRNITWDNITYITLLSMRPEQRLEVAKKAHRLETFRLWTISPRNNHQVHHNSNVLKHPAIRSLEFAEGGQPSRSFADVTGNMELTSLEELTYGVESRPMYAHRFVPRGSLFLLPESRYVIWFKVRTHSRLQGSSRSDTFPRTPLTLLLATREGTHTRRSF